MVRVRHHWPKGQYRPDPRGQYRPRPRRRKVCPPAAPRQVSVDADENTPIPVAEALLELLLCPHKRGEKHALLWRNDRNRHAHCFLCFARVCPAIGKLRLLSNALGAKGSRRWKRDIKTIANSWVSAWPDNSLHHRRAQPCGGTTRACSKLQQVRRPLRAKGGRR